MLTMLLNLLLASSNGYVPADGLDLSGRDFVLGDTAWDIDTDCTSLPIEMREGIEFERFELVKCPGWSKSYLRLAGGGK